jgi:hypothetical protein
MGEGLMGKSYGYVLGSRPAKDPMEEISEDKLIIESDVEIKWIDRNIRRPWGYGAVIGFIVFYSILSSSWSGLIVTGILVLGAIMLPLISKATERSNTDWNIVQGPDLLFKKTGRLPTKPVYVSGVGGQRYSTALSTDSADASLFNHLGRLIRAMSTAEGFCLQVQLWYEKQETILSEDRVSERHLKYFEGLHKSELEMYMKKRSGLWKARTTIVCHSRDHNRLMKLESAIKSVLATHTGFFLGDLRRIWADDLIKRFIHLSLTFEPRFLAIGKELSHWLAQLRDELAGEMKETIPGQFITPIRRTEQIYQLGHTYTPETGELGPKVGVVEHDLQKGILVCGEGDKRGILTLLVSQFLEAKKRVIIISRKENALELCGLSEESAGFVLGKGFILNPVDPDGFERSEYISKLIMAIDVISNKTNQYLSAATEIQKALGKAVAVAHSTVADVSFDDDVDYSRISKDSQLGMECIRTLTEGVGAEQFYGNQTVKVSRFDEVPLAVIVLPITNENLERFAWDLLSIKLSSLPPDDNRVIIFEDPCHFKTTTKAYNQRSSWEGTLYGLVKNLGPFIISVGSPSSIGGISGDPKTIIATRLRNNRDIAVAEDLLKIKSYLPLHTKSREGHRATSILSSLRDEEAILMRSDAITPVPVILDTPLEMNPFDEEGNASRVRAIQESMVIKPQDPHSLIDYVSRGNSELIIEILKILKRYEPVSREGIERFLKAKGIEGDVDSALIRLEEAAMIIGSQDSIGSTSYQNYRINMKGRTALRQSLEESEGVAA